MSVFFRIAIDGLEPGFFTHFWKGYISAKIYFHTICQSQGPFREFTLIQKVHVSLILIANTNLQTCFKPISIYKRFDGFQKQDYYTIQFISILT